MATEQPIPSNHELAEELANSLSHGLGLCLSVAGLVLLIVAAQRGTAWHIVACSIYGASLVLVYLASTLYHSIGHPRIKNLFRVFDHSAIFLLIAGTYTPFALVTLRGGWGWSLLGSVWGLALLGIIFKAIWKDGFHAAFVGLYILMGWLAIIAVKPLFAALSWGGMSWLLLGGIFYTLGVPFYASKRLPFGHTVWHGFVLGGSACHFCAVWLYVLPHAARLS
jgi:hemolysin III